MSSIMFVRIIWLVLLLNSTCEAGHVRRASGHYFRTEDNWAYCRRRSVKVKPSGSDDGSVLTHALYKLGREGGGSVHLRHGNYKLTSPIKLSSRTCVIGDGHVIFRVRKRMLSAVSGRRVHRVSMHGFSIQGGHYIDNGIELGGANMTWIQHVDVRGAKEWGFVVHGISEAGTRHALIEDVMVDGTGISLYDVSHATIRRGFALASPGTPINITASKDVWLQDLVIAGGTLPPASVCAVTVHESSLVSMKRLRVHNARLAAICVWSCTDVYVRALRASNDRFQLARCLDQHDSYRVSNKYMQCNEEFIPPPSSLQPQCRGIQSGKACCSSGCSACGGFGCGALSSKLNKGAMCCISSIRASGRKCANTTPPCLL